MIIRFHLYMGYVSKRGAESYGGMRRRPPGAWCPDLKRSSLMTASLESDICSPHVGQWNQMHQARISADVPSLYATV